DVAITDATRPQLYYKSSFAHSGSYSLLLNYRGVYAMPALSEEVPINDVKLEMYLRQPNAAYRLEVGVWDDATNTFERVQLINNSTTTVEQVTVDFSNYTGSGRRIAFRNVLGDGVNYKYSYNYIDDITLTEISYQECGITLPYSEDFDSYTESTAAATGAEPECWELVRSDVAITDATRPQLYYKSSFAHSGSYSLLLNYRGVYAMPALSEEVPINDVKLEMYLRQPNAAYRLEVGVWDDATNTFERVQLINNSTTTVEQVTVDFSNYTGSGRRIAFRNVLGSGNYNYSYNYIDDITLNVKSGAPCPGTPTVTDIDGNVYNTVQIGGQCWMRENLRTTRYADGNTINHGDEYSFIYNYSNSDYYMNHPYNNTLYGLFYNWYAVMHGAVSSNATLMGVQGICPEGWHVPSDIEWTLLTDYVSSQSQYSCNNNSLYIAKALAHTEDWLNYYNSCSPGYNIVSNNSTGFSALPSGHIDEDTYLFSYDYYFDFGQSIHFWSSTEQGGSSAYNCYLDYTEEVVGRSSIDKGYGLSVRCLRNDEHSPYYPTVTTDDVTNLTPTSATVGGFVSVTNKIEVSSCGLCWSINHNPTINDNFITVSGDIGNFTYNLTGLVSNQTYYVRAYATNAYGTVYGNEVWFTTPVNPNGDFLSCPGVPTVTDIDGNVYNTVQIGGQCWMRENLRTTTYTDGTTITQGNYSSFTTSYWYYPNGDSINKQNYGLLYNLSAIMHESSSSDATPSGVQGICPNGWHLPSDAEWTLLTDFVSSQSDYVCGNDSTCIAKALSAIMGWNNQSSSSCCVGNNQSSNNATGLGILPSGCYDGIYRDFGSNAYFWSTSENGLSYVWYRYLTYYGSVVYKLANPNKSRGYSVRCLHDEDVSQYFPTVTTNDITNIAATSAVCGGNVTASDGVGVTARGVCWGINHNPTIADSHTTDGDNTGIFTSNLTGLISNIPYYVRAYATNQYGTVYGNEVSFSTNANPNGDELSCSGTPTLTDQDGNIYNTVQIGNQCWMRENLKTTHYADGTSIAQGNNYSETVAYWYYPYNSSSKKPIYGLLYNWKAVMRDASSSINNPSGVQGVCPNGWHVPSNAEWVQLQYYVSCQSQNTNDNFVSMISSPLWRGSNGNNTTGFSALPAGYGYGEYNYGFGSYAFFWSATEINSSNSISCYFSSDNYYSINDSHSKHLGLSVRCLRDENNVVVDEKSCPAAPTVTDHEGNVYATVQIGGQCWMRENLRTTRFSDGTDIPYGSSTYNSTPFRYYPYNDSTNVSTYGFLYNWAAIMQGLSSSGNTPSGVQGICPVGWHVPSDGEWMQLRDYLSGQNEYKCNGDIAKALAAVTGWNSTTNQCCVGYEPNTNNATGFNALPAGSTYSEYGWEAIFGSATESSSSNMWIYELSFQGSDFIRASSSKNSGYSIRCLKNEDSSSSLLPTVNTNAVSNVAATSATCGGNVTYEGSSSVIARGVCWSTSHNPNIMTAPHTTDGSGIGSFGSSITGLASNLTYYVRAYATNQYGTVYGNEVSISIPVNPNGDEKSCPGTPILTDVDDNVYNTIQIGGQCWMRENLKVTKYADGTVLALGATSSATIPYRKYPYNDSTNVSLYGYLYNWPAVMRGVSSSDATPSGVQGICPSGWHLPSDAEWAQLADYVGSQSEYLCGNNSTSIAKALAAATEWRRGWNYCSVGENVNSNNATGFGALPAGNGGSTFGEHAWFWSSTESSEDYVWVRDVDYHHASFDRTDNVSHKYSNFSVRCLRDESSPLLPSVITNAITNVTATTATCGGNVTADGGEAITARGVCWSTLHNPKVDDTHTTDGAGTGSFSSSITGLLPNLTYYVRAYATNMYGTVYGDEVSISIPINSNGDEKSCPGTPTVTDIDGNVYNTVLIGGQCWMRENLKTTRFANGSVISRLSPSIVSSYPHLYYPGDASANVINYGCLYNWAAVMHGASSSNDIPSGVQGVCPNGWHVPSSAEWSVLVNYVGNQSQYLCNNNSNAIAKALASSIGWNNSNGICNVGNNQSTNNTAGFSAMPAGEKMWGTGGTAYFWSTTEYSNGYAWSYSLNYNSDSVKRASEYDNAGLSVRCLRDAGVVIVDEKSCPAAPTVTDHEGNVYATVQIGNQCWMRNNLRTTTSPGTGTYLVNNQYTSGANIAYTYTGKMARWYNNDSATYAPMNYGLLYNWNAAVDTFNTAYGETSVNTSSSNVVSVTFNGHRRGICPVGWHLPSDAEWNTMEATVSGSDWQTSYETTKNYRGSHAGKLAGGDNWTSRSTSGAPGDYGNADRNVSGFSAVPAGTYNYSSFNNAGYRAEFWGATQDADNPRYAYDRYLYCDNAGVGRFNYDKNTGFSVRCLRDAGTAVVDEKSCPDIPTVTDHEGNVYATVQIGNQCWMRDNLRTTICADGTAISAGGDSTSQTTPYYYDYSSHSLPLETRGYLYNWPAAIVACPIGWHLPSKTEWTALTDYVGSCNEYTCGENSNYIAKALSSKEGWLTSSNSCAVGNNQMLNNASGFGAVPAGDCIGTSFGLAGSYALFWSSTASNDGLSYGCNLRDIIASVSSCVGFRTFGFSVRCLRDNPNNKSGESNENPNSAISDDTSLEMADIDAPLGVNDFTDGTMDVILYPNPTKDVVNVQCTMYNVQCSGIEVIDVYGKVVRNVVVANNDSPTQINVSGLAAGMYFVRVTTDRGVVTKPFVKR
ncbi:MAG: T9SS type A sorting domain-containing protein, partial [Bacteroidales bacterium]|nr:T9SS type A sorting domain-containing protein [Bacteroidales bacterium]